MRSPVAPAAPWQSCHSSSGEAFTYGAWSPAAPASNDPGLGGCFEPGIRARFTRLVSDGVDAPSTASMRQSGRVKTATGEASMDKVSTIGIDLAKHVFQLHGASGDGAVLFRRRLRREKLLEFLATQPRCVVAMEACASAHYWGREIGRLGHQVRLTADSVNISSSGRTTWRMPRRSVRQRNADHAVRSGQERGADASAMIFKVRDLSFAAGYSSPWCHSTLATTRRGLAQLCAW